MPPIILAFFILIGAATGPPFIKALITPPDPTMRSRFGKPAPQEFRTWTSVPWLAESSTGTCDVTYFALATRNRVVRLEAGGVEQLLDSTWAFPRTLSVGERHAMALTFRDPVGGAVLSCQEQTVACISSRGVGAVSTDTREGRCAPDAGTPGRKGGKPRLTARTAPFTMYDSAVGGAFVDVEFSITGDVDEEWYCPKIEVEWPDQTRATRESDCVPFESRDPEVRFSWKFNHGFGAGEWPVKACISKSGKTLACEVALVRVVGGE